MFNELFVVFQYCYIYVCIYVFFVYERAEQISREYASVKGVETTARPQNHLFFRKLGPIVKRTLEKCERENGMMYT